MKRVKRRIAMLLALAMLLIPTISAMANWHQTDDGKYYFRDNNGYRFVGWHEIDGEWYYFDNLGYMVEEEWELFENGKPDQGYLKRGGAMAHSEWYEIKDKWYYFDKNGLPLKNEWKELESGEKCYLGADGAMVVQAWVDDKYYMNKNGVIAKNAIVPTKNKGLAYIPENGVFDPTFNKNGMTLCGVLFNVNNGIVLILDTANVSTPNNAQDIESLLDILENREVDDRSAYKELADAVAGAVTGSVSEKDIDKDSAEKMDKLLKDTYGMQDQDVTSEAEAEGLSVQGSGLIAAAGLTSADFADGKQPKLVLSLAASPANATKTETKMDFDIKLLLDGETVDGLKSPVFVKLTLPESFKCDFFNYTYKLEHNDEEVKNAVFAKAGSRLTVEFSVDHFSKFTVTATVKDPGKEPASGGSGSSGGSSGGGSYGGGGSSSRSTTGTGTVGASGKWVQDETGWWYSYANGTWPANGWAQLNYNGAVDWYYFNANGYMMTGWVDWEGNRYYLNPISDGTQGKMLTGWQLIDGKYYYFRPESGGPQGSLFVNGTTPDGYNVDANGVWIQ